MNDFQKKLDALLTAKEKKNRYEKQYYETGPNDPLTLKEVMEAREAKNSCQVACFKEIIKDFTWTAAPPNPGHCYVNFLKITAKRDNISDHLSLIPDFTLLTRFKGEYNYFDFSKENELVIRFNTFDDMFDFIQETGIKVDLRHVKTYINRIQCKLKQMDAT